MELRIPPHKPLLPSVFRCAVERLRRLNRLRKGLPRYVERGTSLRERLRVYAVEYHPLAPLERGLIRLQERYRVELKWPR